MVQEMFLLPMAAADISGTGWLTDVGSDFVHWTADYGSEIAPRNSMEGFWFTYAGVLLSASLAGAGIMWRKAGIILDIPISGHYDPYSVTFHHAMYRPCRCIRIPASCCSVQRGNNRERSYLTKKTVSVKAAGR